MRSPASLAYSLQKGRSFTLANDYYDNRGGVRPGISRSGSGSRAGSASRTGSYGSRPGSGSRSASGSRSGSGSRSASGSRSGSASRQSYGARPSGSRPSGGRPSGNRPPQRRRRKAQGRFYAIVAVAAVLLVALIIILAKPGGQKDPAVAASNPTSGQPANGGTEAAVPAGFEDMDTGEEEQGTQYSSIADMLASDDSSEVEGLSETQMALISDLAVNTSLPDDWLNVLLLGTDDRKMRSSSRTDAMIICSINRKTGEVKLASIMRDLDVNLHDIGKYSGHWRINAANFFGGPKLAIRTVNECFNMNIKYYVMVNFFGFQRIAERLGGIDIDISEEEMNQINVWAWHSYKVARKHGIDVSDVTYEKLTSFGPNTHLNGTQALGYARIRKLNGGDYRRAERQREVLGKLMEKAKKLSAMEIAALGAEMIGEVRTNLEINDIINTAIMVAGNGLSGYETIQLPVTGTFKQETRNNDSRLWDCDFAANALQLYNFIYE